MNFTKKAFITIKRFIKRSLIITLNKAELQAPKRLKKYHYNMSFASNLREFLDIREIQIKELSAKTGISKNTIDNYLSGQKSIPNADNAIKIAKALNTTVEFLFTGKLSNSSSQSEPRAKPEIPSKYKKLFSSIQKLDKADFSTITAVVENMMRRY